MKVFWIVLVSMCASAAVSADQYKTVTHKYESKRLSYEVSYPHLFQNSVPAYRAVNVGIKKASFDAGCTENSPDKNPFYAKVRSSIVALNATYIGIAITFESWCGGAYPSYGTSYATFDSNSGASVDVAKEFGIDYDSDNYDKIQRIQTRFAELIVDRIPTDLDESCFQGMDRLEKIDTLVSYSSGPVGLAKDKKVVVAIDPPHVAGVCAFEVRVDYALVMDLLPAGSILHQWLR